MALNRSRRSCLIVAGHRSMWPQAMAKKKPRRDSFCQGVVIYEGAAVATSA
ncbi:hypothetical protein [Oceanidesulfovibrio marinus]|uniref:hypothetical protein n=1 Tax=Oceanidesulfovibrio marinus TaxID=370038 RepID=UPI00148B1384|nr:hypothetical protein [Oceanidesulfovibrio marinus]